MSEEFNLSDEIIFGGLSSDKVKDDSDHAIIQRCYVKEFIKLLKEELRGNINSHALIVKIIDKLAGEKLK